MYQSVFFNFRVSQQGSALLKWAFPKEIYCAFGKTDFSKAVCVAHCPCIAQTMSSSATRTTPILPRSLLPSSLQQESDSLNANDAHSRDTRREEQREDRGPGRGRSGRGRFYGRGRGRGSSVSQIRNTDVSSGPQHPRLFLGIELPKEIRESLTTLGTEHLPMVRTLPSSSYHITLHFLGMTDLQKLQSLLDELVKTKRDLMPRAFAVRIRGVGAFPKPNESSARVLWAGVEQPCDELLQLHQFLREGLDAGGYQVEDRPYMPHITIAKRNTSKRNPRQRRRQQQQQQQDELQQQQGEQRQQQQHEIGCRDNDDGDEMGCQVNPPIGTNTVSRWVEKYKQVDYGRVDVHEFVIYETISGHEKPIYEVRGRYNLTDNVNQGPS